VAGQGELVHHLRAAAPEHNPAVHVLDDDGVLRKVEQRRLLGENGGLLLEGLRSFNQGGRARGHFDLEPLAVLVVVLAVGLEAQEISHPHTQLGTIHGLGEKIFGSGLSGLNNRLKSSALLQSQCLQ
jgi:hypothetical protein